MYSDSNNLINKCAKTMQEQFALNVRFLDTVFQSQCNWINRTIDQQQALNKAVLDSDDLSQVSEKSQVYAEGMVESWISDCQEAYKTLQQQGEDVSNFYRLSAIDLEKSNNISTKIPAIVEEKVVKKAQVVVKPKQPAAKKAVAKKAVTSTTKRDSVAKVAKKSITPTPNDIKLGEIKPVKSESIKPISVKPKQSTVKLPKTVPVKAKQTPQAEGKVAVKKTAVKTNKPAVIEKKVESIVAPAKELQAKKPAIAKNDIEKAPVSS